MNGAEGEPQPTDWCLGFVFPDDGSSFRAWEMTRNLLFYDGFAIGVRRLKIGDVYCLAIHGETPLSEMEQVAITAATIHGEPVELPEGIRDLLRSRRKENLDRDPSGITETHLIDGGAS